MTEIKALNNLTSDAIYVGDKLIIRLANTPGPTATVTATSTPTRAATPTRKPTRTPTPSATPIGHTAQPPPADPDAEGSSSHRTQTSWGTSW